MTVAKTCLASIRDSAKGEGSLISLKRAREGMAEVCGHGPLFGPIFGLHRREAVLDWRRVFVRQSSIEQNG